MKTVSACRMRGKHGQLVPVNAFARIERTRINNAVNHQGQLPSVTLSFNLAAGASLSDAVQRKWQRSRPG